MSRRGAQKIPTRVEPSARALALDGRAVSRRFASLLDSGVELRVDGSSAGEPHSLLEEGYSPKHAFELFGHCFYLANVRQNPLLRFFVAYVVPPPAAGRPRRAHARIFYKDVSLIWRSGSHGLFTETDLWIGKGATRVHHADGHQHEHTIESTTDLPFEMQDVLDELMRRPKRIRRDTEILERVLRGAPPHRLAPYADFLEPRRRAAADPRNLVNAGRPIARFRREHVPESLVIVRGFEPDFRMGRIELTTTSSASYGGQVRRHRFLSANRRIQWLFFEAPEHVWIAPPQALTTELSSYGVRTVDVEVPDDLCLPGYEYHYLDDPDHEDSLHSQIPPGFAGAANPHDPDRADASEWLERLPVVAEFRRHLRRR